MVAVGLSQAQVRAEVAWEIGSGAEPLQAWPTSFEFVRVRTLFDDVAVLSPKFKNI